MFDHKFIDMLTSQDKVDSPGSVDSKGLIFQLVPHTLTKTKNAYATIAVSFDEHHIIYEWNQNHSFAGVDGHYAAVSALP